jgi:cytochrome c oxidase cbb3-type subunit I/II
MLYWLVPQLYKRPLHSVQMATAHFWIATVGIVLYVVSMWVAGITQGLMWRAIDDAGQLAYPSFMDTVIQLIPFYWIRLIGGLLYLGGFLLMGWNLWSTASRTQDVPAGAPAV